MSNKQSIQWHKTILKNYIATLAWKQRTLETLRIEVEEMTQHIEFYQKQIETATEKGKDGFDSERFLKKIP